MGPAPDASRRIRAATRSSAWGSPVVPSWYTNASLVLDLDGNPVAVADREEPSEMAVTIGADGYARSRSELAVLAAATAPGGCWTTVRRAPTATAATRAGLLPVGAGLLKRAAALG